MTEGNILSLLHIGSVATERAQALCLIHMLACDRVTIRTSLLLQPAAAVRIGMRSGAVLEGQVAGHDGRRAIIALRRKVDVALLLQAHRRASSGAESVRLPISQPVEISMGHMRLASHGIDISLQGMRLSDSDALLRPREEVAVHIDGLGLHHGRIVWARDGEAGLRFRHGLGYDQLDTWLRRIGGWRQAPAFGLPERAIGAAASSG